MEKLSDYTNLLTELTKEYDSLQRDYDNLRNENQFQEEQITELSKEKNDLKNTMLGINTGWQYDNANWREQLTSYDGKEITYDNAGNPLSYRDMEFTWQGGRQLAKISKPGVTFPYTYDDEGIRTGKNINGIKVEYFTVDGKITAEKIGDTVTYYRYDENDNPISILRTRREI